MPNNIVSDFLEEINSRGDRYQSSGPPTGEPPKDHDRRRGLVPLPYEQEQHAEPALSIDECRTLIRHKMTEYLMTPDPTYKLLIALPPGGGKTTEAVRQAELMANAGQRILYAGPRHNIWDDLMRASTIAEANRDQFWYHWQPHTAGDPETGQGQTCRYAWQFKKWVERGHEGIDFCSHPKVCGWPYINNACIYHRQKLQPQPIVFVQHLDIALHHPFLKKTNILIGDESPLSAFLYPWRIEPRDIVPSGLFSSEEHAPDTALIELVEALRTLVDSAPPINPETKKPFPAWEGQLLLGQLGGAEHVLDVCDEHSKIDVTAKAAVPAIWSPDQAETVPCWYLDQLLPLLKVEAREAVAGHEYVHRVRVDRQGLTLLLRRRQDQLPSHVIWLDATANPRMYRDIFGGEIEVVAPRVKMTGKVYQVHARLNNKDRLVGGNAERTTRIDHAAERKAVQQQVDQIVRIGRYQRPATISFKAIIDEFGYESAYFGGLRGSNRLQDCDALIVVGTPQAGIPTLRDQAAMLLSGRTLPFDMTWSDRILPYPGHPYGYAASGFWHDKTLQSLLQETRESELVQAAHRVRPLYRPVDVWLLTNLPLAQLPPDRLFSLPELFGSPKGVDPYRWPAVLDLVAMTEDGISADELRKALDLPVRTAERWFAALCTYPGVIVRERPAKTGRPARVCVKDLSADFPPRLYK